MSLVGITLDATEEYESTYDPQKGQEGATKFVLGTLPARVQAMLRDKATKFRPDPNENNNVVAEFLPNEAAFETVRYGLRGWKNFLDAKGDEIEFKTVSRSVAGRQFQVVSEMILDLLPLEVIQELADKIRNLNKASEEERKNFGE